MRAVQAEHTLTNTQCDTCSNLTRQYSQTQEFVVTDRRQVHTKYRPSQERIRAHNATGSSTNPSLSKQHRRK
jgi:hypothetical protein